MGTRPSPTEGPACLTCGTPGHLTSPEDPGDGGLRPGDVVICGLCATVHVLEARQRFDASCDRLEWRPELRRPVLEELEAIRTRPDVKRLLDAYELAAMERRIRDTSRKGPKPGKGLQLIPGGKLKLEGHGPDYRGPHLL